VKSVRQILAIMDKHGKQKACFLVFLMMVGSALEAFSIGMVLVFVTAVNESFIANQGISNIWLNTLYKAFKFQSVSAFFISIGIGLCIVYALKNTFLFYQSYRQNSFIYREQAKLSNLLLGHYLSAQYTFHIQKNSAEILRNITVSTDTMFGNGFSPIMNILAELFVICAITIVLIFVEPFTTICAFVVISVLVALFFKVVRKRIVLTGHTVNELSADILLWTNQSLGGIKELKLLGREKYFLHVFSQLRNKYAKGMTYVTTMQKIPRLYLEVVLITGMLLILVTLIARGAETRHFIPIVSVFAMASVRLLPSVTQIVTSLNSLKFGSAAIDAISKEMANLSPAGNKIREEDRLMPLVSVNNIALKNITFAYPGSHKPSISDINLTIPFGTSVAFIGPSGSGKTTIVDIILGLLEPTKGTVELDGKNIHQDNYFLMSWQKTIGYIPQNIYLMDDTLQRNIAFGITDENIDEKRVFEVVKDAHLEDFVHSLPQKLNTRVGERGVRLSGGQRQRIGIARALYHDPKVLVLDEATSSLDNETEAEISRAIDEFGGKKTVLLIAHRLSTIRHCNKLFFIKDGLLDDTGSFDELYSRNIAFRQMTQYSEINQRETKGI
jgi:ABC-type multidrug transport system fused ATPase/permease subunit